MIVYLEKLKESMMESTQRIKEFTRRVVIKLTYKISRLHIYVPIRRHNGRENPIYSNNNTKIKY